MKQKFTLLVLAAFLMAVSSFAQDPVSARPLSAKHKEAVAQLFGKNAKQQPSQKSLHMQKSLDLSQGLRTATTVHNKQVGKTAVKKQPAAMRRAAADIISEQPEGKQVFYSRSGSAYYYSYFGVLSTEFSGAVGNVVFGDNNEVYIKNIISQASTNAWVKGTISGSTITIQLPQSVLYYDDYGYGLEVSKLVYDAAEQWYVKDADQTLKLNYDAATGKISMKSGDMVGLTYDDDSSWSGYSDWNMVLEAVTDELVEAPAGLQTETYSLAADGYAGSLVQIGFSGNDVYVQGLDPNLPDNWVKGTIDGNKAIFKSGQYIGADEVAGYHQYLLSSTSEEAYDEYWDEYYTVYALSDADIVFDYDAATKSFSNSTSFLINAGTKEVNYYAAFDKARMAPFTEVAATPADPVISQLYEGGIGYYNSGYGWGYLAFNLNTSDVDGNYILPEKLSYQLYTKVNGEVKPLALSWWDYQYQQEETLTELPYGYSDGWDIYANGAEQSVYYYVIGPEAYGVQAIYRGAGEERRSEIAWAEVTELGAEIQPEAATPDYPEATVSDDDNRIDYGYYTGNENISTTTNNSKPETYDVAIHLDDPALVGALIESITFPLQELQGVSNLSVFLTSQLRLEDNKNAADLAVKAVEPTEAGFVTVTLDKPYRIPEEGVYVGYSMTVDDVSFEANETPVAVVTDVHQGGLFLHTSEGFLKWMDFSEMLGGSAMIQVKLAGDAIKANAVSLVDVPTTYVVTGEAYTVPVTVVNHGSQGISTLSLSYSVNGEQGSQQFSTEVDGFFGKSTTVQLELPAIPVKGNYELDIVADKVNDVSNEDANNATTVPVVALNTVPKKRALLEEYTGFWCGWCPRGYVGLEKLAELYPDDYVLVSYHNGDELEIMADDNFPSYVAGYPDGWMDRDVEVDAYYGIVYGEKDFGIADDLAARNKLFGQADIDFSSALSADASSVSIDAEVTFPYDLADGNFVLEYILTADGLTDPSWSQSNYYANGEAGFPEYMDDFTTTSDDHILGLVYNDVAVLTSEMLGGSKNAITAAAAETPVKFTYSFNLSDAVNTSFQPVIQDVNNLKVVALLVDANTGAVVNANVAKVGASTGISISENTQKPQTNACYDLTGRRVQKPVKGLYIINGRKVVVK